MSKTQLAYVKSKRHIDASYTAEDADMQDYIDAAEDYIQNETQRSLAELCEYSQSGIDLPNPLKRAVVALVESWCNTVGATTSFSVNPVELNLNALISPYKRLV